MSAEEVAVAEAEAAGGKLSLRLNEAGVAVKAVRFGRRTAKRAAVPTGHRPLSFDSEACGL